MSQIVRTQKIVSGGDCLAQINGKNVFIPFALPSETLEIEITKSFRDYDMAKITRVLEASPHRVTPFCPLYGLCGGCNMQHINIEEQKNLRKEILKDCFEREGIKNLPEIEIISGNDRNYRSRVQLTNGGFNKKESNEIVHLEACPIATKEINEYFKNTVQNARPTGRVHIFGDERITSDANGISKKLIVAEERDKSAFSKEVKLEGKISQKRREKLKLQQNRQFQGSSLNQNNRCRVKLLEKNIAFDVQGFFQSNLEVLEKSITEISKNLGGNNLLDMYSGCGTFSVFLSDFFEKTCLVEHNRDAIVFAEENLSGKKHESFGLSGEKWVKFSAENYIKANGSFDAVVIDPPRSGMEKEVSKWLCSKKIPQLRSVSCNPSTHARDASFLVKSGYKLTKLYLLDFYPHTSHIESMAFFEYTE